MTDHSTAAGQNDFANFKKDGSESTVASSAASGGTAAPEAAIAKNSDPATAPDIVSGFGRFEEYGYLPVFANRNAYFAGRDRGDMAGVVAKLAVGDRVDFQQYRDWGAGQIFDADGNVVGWTDPEGFAA